MSELNKKIDVFEYNQSISNKKMLDLNIESDTLKSKTLDIRKEKEDLEYSIVVQTIRSANSQSKLNQQVASVTNAGA